MISKKFKIFLNLLIFATIVSAQQNPNIEDTINSIFNTNNSNRPGFGTFVTPSAPASEDIRSTSGRGPCNCVPYHLCDPNTNTQTDSTDDTFDGFGLIDLRIDSDTAPVCEHFLDVCCDGNQTRSESVQVPAQETKPNRPRGCGIRNVGGK